MNRLNNLTSNISSMVGASLNWSNSIIGMTIFVQCMTLIRIISTATFSMHSIISNRMNRYTMVAQIVTRIITIMMIMALDRALVNIVIVAILGGIQLE